MCLHIYFCKDHFLRLLFHSLYLCINLYFMLTEMNSFWESPVDLSSTDCDLLSVDIQLEPLMSLFTDLRDSMSPIPPTTPCSKKGGSLEKQFRTPKFGMFYFLITLSSVCKRGQVRCRKFVSTSKSLLRHCQPLL